MRQVKIYPGEDDYWVAEVPSLPGCISQGKSREEAVSNVKEAIDAYINALKEDGLSVDTDLELYEKIEESPGENIHRLSQAMGWTRGKTYTAARRLEKAGMVHVEKAEKNGRHVLVVKPKAWQEYFTPEELEKIKQMKI